MFLFLLIRSAIAHGAMKEPPSRVYLGHPDHRKSSGVNDCAIPKNLSANYEWNGLGRDKSISKEVEQRGRQENNNLAPHEIGPACGNGELKAGTLLKYGEYRTNQFGVTRAYQPGSILTLEFNVTAMHGGHTWVDYACFDGKTDKFAHDESIQWKRLNLATGGTTKTWEQYTAPSYDVVLPDETCDHAVLQWSWFGEQSVSGVETFFNCADIQLTNGASNLGCPDGSGSSSNVPGIQQPSEPNHQGGLPVPGIQQPSEPNHQGGLPVPGIQQPSVRAGSAAADQDSKISSSLPLIIGLGAALVVLVVIAYAWSSHSRKKKEDLKSKKKPSRHTRGVSTRNDVELSMTDRLFNNTRPRIPLRTRDMRRRLE